MKLELSYFDHQIRVNNKSVTREIRLFKIHSTDYTFSLPALELDVVVKFVHPPTELLISSTTVLIRFAKPDHVDEAVQAIDEALMTVAELDKLSLRMM